MTPDSTCPHGFARCSLCHDASGRLWEHVSFHEEPEPPPPRRLRHPHNVRSGDVLNIDDVTVTFHRVEGRIVANILARDDAVIVWDRTRPEREED